MKLQAVSVCVNYADFFVHVAEANYGIFDKWVIVTDTKDIEVSAICEKYGYVCIKTDVFYENGAKFNKYAGVNVGLQHIDQDAWVVILDSDIVLQQETRRVLQNIELDKTKLYGIDRLNCVGYSQWKAYKDGTGVLTHNWLLTNAGLEFGSRLVHLYGHEGEQGRFEGYRPLGFFQLCYRGEFGLHPENTLGADHCDMEFARLWRRRDRVLIPELLAIHLESVRAGKGVNWYGRKSQYFGPGDGSEKPKEHCPDYPGKNGKPFRILLSDEWFMVGDEIQTGYENIKCIVLKIYKPTWWKKLLNKIGFKFIVDGILVKPI